MDMVGMAALLAFRDTGWEGAFEASGLRGGGGGRDVVYVGIVVMSHGRRSWPVISLHVDLDLDRYSLAAPTANQII